MNQPSEAHHHNLGRGGEVGPDPVGRRVEALRWLVVGALALRVVLAALEVQSVAGDGMRSLPFVSSVSFGSSSLVWPAMWGLLALVAAVALAIGMRAGWLLGVAVTVAYLAAGIADVSALADTFDQDLGRAAWTVGIGMGVPLLVLAGLASIASRYGPSRQTLEPAGRRVRQATPPSLYRWRRGRS